MPDSLHGRWMAHRTNAHILKAALGLNQADSKMKIVIVGGGVMGMACAWRLAQRGARVTLLDQGNFGSGASSAALGALWPSSMLNPGPLQQLQRESLWQYATFVDELAIASGRSVGYLCQGKLEFITSARQLEQHSREVEFTNHSWPPMAGTKATQPAMEIVSQDDARKLEPSVTIGPFGAVVCHRSAQVDVKDLLVALQSACERSGVDMRPNTAVLDIKPRSGHPFIKTSKGEFESDSVLLCAGIGLAHLAELQKVFPAIKPVKGQALLLHCNHNVIERIIKNGSIFLVPWPDGRVLVGSTTEPAAGFDTSNTAAGVELLTHGAIETCPALANARIESIWAGLRPTGPKRQPVMGPIPGLPKIFICAGHFKVGIGMAPLSADIMTRWLLGGEITADERHFTPHMDAEAPQVHAG